MGTLHPPPPASHANPRRAAPTEAAESPPTHTPPELDASPPRAARSAAHSSLGRRDREQDLPLRTRVVGAEDGGDCPVHLRLVPVRVRAADRHRKRLGLGRGGQASGGARRSDAPLPLRCARPARGVHLGRTARAQHRKAWRSSMHSSIDGRGRRSRMHASRPPARRSLLAERVLPVRRSLLARRAKPSSKGAAEEDPRERHEAPHSPLALQLEPLARTLSATSRSHHRRWRGGRCWRLRRRRRRGRRAMRRASRSGRAASCGRCSATLASHLQPRCSSVSDDRHAARGHSHRLRHDDLRCLEHGGPGDRLLRCSERGLDAFREPVRHQVSGNTSVSLVIPCVS